MAGTDDEPVLVREGRTKKKANLLKRTSNVIAAALRRFSIGKPRAKAKKVNSLSRSTRAGFNATDGEQDSCKFLHEIKRCNSSFITLSLPYVMFLK